MSNGSNQIARNNHYVPQMLLRRWSRDGSSIFARRLLVPSSRMPEWRQRPLGGLAYQRDLYTSFMTGHEADEFERMVALEFEQPGSEAIDRVVSGDRLRREHWHSLARLFALQDLRTPASFVEQMDRWQQDLPAVMDTVVRSSLDELARAKAEGRSVDPPPAGATGFNGLLAVSVEPASRPGQQGQVKTEVGLGRGFWLASMQHLLGGVVRELTEHKWSIVEAEDGVEWPLTDHPALKLNYYGPGCYDFGGGWGRRNVDLVMPLSPRHLLYSQVGKDYGRRVTFPPSVASQIRLFLLERAHRWVFASAPSDWIVRARPRVADPEAYGREIAMWGRWHEEQSTMERAAVS